jgi:ATP-binding cassette subfamily G (WHITE) protein 2
MLLLDEPTSGLDATSAQMVGDALRRMSAADGTSSLCSIHQPRASLLAVFDVLLLLAEGRVVYNGPINLAGDRGVLSYFAQNGFACPPLENPADWLLDLVHGAEAGAEAPKRQDVEAAAGDVQAGRVARAERFAALYAASPLAAASMKPPAEPPAPLPATGRGSEHGLFPTSWWAQFSAIWRRTLLYKLREPAAVMTQASTAVVMPLIVGGIFWSVSLSQSFVSDRLAAVSFTVLMQGAYARHA